MDLSEIGTLVQNYAPLVYGVSGVIGTVIISAFGYQAVKHISDNRLAREQMASDPETIAARANADRLRDEQMLAIRTHPDIIALIARRESLAESYIRDERDSGENIYPADVNDYLDSITGRLPKGLEN